MKNRTGILTTLFTQLSFAQDSFFPIWGDEAEKRGYSLPKPYGLSLSYMDMSNPITVNSIDLTGHPVLEALDIDANHADFKGSNITLRGDVWIFPFMNIYGIIGYTQGTSTAKINALSCDTSSVQGIGNKVLCSLLDAAGDELPDSAAFELEMDGGTYGAGTLAEEFDQLGQDEWLYSVGVGYRFEIKQRVNLRLDIGFGNDQSGFYFAINEAF
ncbi:hypothetical protein CGJ17_06215 [Vibrio parahaemolyticus]|nr:hypothetical protein CGJ17_06215 [Vibrio parahaemolyticus]TOF76130.1 hypothetical protein CGJ18_04365 [Vibrio parahaemolyticus]